MTHHHDERCRKYFERLSELLDGELDDATARTIRAHVEACPECRVCLSTFSKSVEIFQNLGQSPVPDETWSALKDFIRRSAESEKQDGRPEGRP